MLWMQKAYTHPYKKTSGAGLY